MTFLLKRHWRMIAAFLVLAGIAFALSLKLGPPLTWDEGWYCLVGRSWQAFVAAALHGPFEGFGPAFTRFFAEQNGTLFMHTTAKPVFVGLQVAALAMTGGWLPSLALPQVLAFAGTILLVWCWAKDWAASANVSWPKAFPWVAAGVAATSPFLLYFGASFYPHPIAAFFLTAALWRGWKHEAGARQASLIGTLLAFATFSHYSLWPIVIPLLVWFAWQRRRQGRESLWLILGCALPVALFVAGSLAFTSIVDRHIQAELVWSYPKEIIEQFRGTASAADTMSYHPSYYLARIIALEGWPTLVFLCAGTLAAARARRGSLGGVVVWCWFSFAFFSSLHAVGARTIMPLLPSAFLVASAGLWTLIDRIKNRKPRVVMLCTVVAIIIAFRLPCIEKLLRFENPWRMAATAVPSDGGTIPMSEEWPIFSCILNRRVSNISDADTHASVIAEFPLAEHATVNLWDDARFGEPVSPEQRVRIYR